MNADWRLADGFSLFHGVQLVVDTTMVSPVRVSERRQCSTKDVAQACVLQERTYPEFAARLVVMVCEVGLWSDEASFLNSLGAG